MKGRFELIADDLRALEIINRILLRQSEGEVKFAMFLKHFMAFWAQGMG